MEVKLFSKGEIIKGGSGEINESTMNLPKTMTKEEITKSLQIGQVGNTWDGTLSILNLAELLADIYKKLEECQSKRYIVGDISEKEEQLIERYSSNLEKGLFFEYKDTLINFLTEHKNLNHE